MTRDTQAKYIFYYIFLMENNMLFLNK